MGQNGESKILDFIYLLGAARLAKGRKGMIENLLLHFILLMFSISALYGTIFCPPKAKPLIGGDL